MSKGYKLLVLIGVLLLMTLTLTALAPPEPPLVNVTVDNVPGDDPFWVHGEKVLNEPPPLPPVAVLLTFTSALDGESSETVPPGKIAVVEYLSCKLTGNGLGFISQIQVGSSEGRIPLELDVTTIEPNIATGSFQSPLKLYIDESEHLTVNTAVQQVAQQVFFSIKCVATGYYISK